MQGVGPDNAAHSVTNSPPGGGLFVGGDPYRNRTCNLQLRRLSLYPVELRGRVIMWRY